MKNLTQLPWSGKGSKAKNDNTLGRMRGGIRSRIGSMSLKSTSLFGVILALLLTFGVGEMWGITFSGGYVYFDNTNTNWSDGVIEVVAHQYTDHDYIGCSTMSKISGTNNLYYYANPTGSGWGGIWGWRFMSNSSAWGSQNSSEANLKKYATHYTASDNSSGITSNYSYLCYGASSTNNCTLTRTELGNSATQYNSLNYTQTVNQTLSTDGGGTYSTSTASLATISVSANKLNGRNTTTSNNGTISAGNSSATCSAARTATVTYTVSDVATGYTFVGWYDGSTQKSTSTTYTYNATEAKTITARFKSEETHNVTVYYKYGSTTVKTATTESAVGVSTARSFTAPEIDGYNFFSYEFGSGLTMKSANTTTNPCSFVTKASGTYELTVNYNIAPVNMYYGSTSTFSNSSYSAMTYDAPAKAYYVDVTTNSSPYYFRFNFNTNTQEYAADWNTYPDVVEATVNGAKVACDQTVKNWDNKSSVKFTGDNGSSIRIWFDYQNKKAWITETTYTITVANDGHGSTSAGSVTAGRNTLSSSVTATPNSGYSFSNWTRSTSNITITSSTSASTTVKATSSGTITANFTPNNYTITLHEQGATTHGTPGDGGTITATFDANTNLTGAITTPEKTGYTFNGYYDTPECDGAWIIKDDGYFNWDGTYLNSSTGVWKYVGNVDLYAKWIASNYTITLDVDEDHKGTIAGATTSQTIYYGDATVTIPNLPTAADGYGLDGYYTDHNGAGTKVINGDGTWIASVEGYTDANKKWIHAGDVTLYAYYKQAEISDLTPAPAIIAPGETVTVTPTLSPAPAGTHIICWELQYSNGTALPSQPTFTPEAGNAVSFPAPSASATYRIQATLRSGSSCGGGSVLSTRAATFQVAGDHTVTVQYKCGDMTIAESVELDEIKPLIWSDGITAPSITGYTFSGWVAGDGVTIRDGESSTATTHIKATYDGTLTANYTRKRMIYFYNTLNWSNVYVYFYKNNSYWNNSKGTGADNTYTFTNTPYSEQKHGQMLPIEEGSKIYYFDAEAAGVNASYTTVAFTELNQHGYGYFAQTDGVNNKVIRRDDYKSTTMPMFVPSDQTPTTMNGGLADYYNSGYWMNYPENSGYTLKIYDAWNATKETAAVRSFAFPYSGDLKMPLKMDVEFNEANHDYWFMIYRNDGTYLGNTYNFKQGWNEEQVITGGDNKSEITTSAPGNYTLTLTYHDENYYIDVDFPIASGDYRIYYSDNATWSQGAHTKNSWNHPSHSIAKATTEAKKDTVSFFIPKGDGISHTMKFQKASVNGEGVVSWADVSGGSITIPSSVTSSGVYNFIVSQPSGGASISLEKVEPYTGNFYIRTDCAGNTKWDSFKNVDHQMTYSDYAEANSGYSHYYTHWVESGNNVSFTIANDYSMCISDTLVEDYGTTIADISNVGALNSGNASIRFMWNQATNKISRAYISGSSNISDRFLVLEGDEKMYDENGNALSITGLNANEINLVDDQNFVYERTIKVQTGAEAKLTAKYNNNVQYFIGGSGSTAADSVVLLGGTASATKYSMRIVYDFKTNRLVKAYIPSGADITEDLAINADIMLVREHQEAGQQLTFNGGSLSKVQTVYGVMRFNRWTLNNKQTTGEHSVVGDPKSIYERSLYWISFPFDVNLSDVFGFGTYGTHWIIEYYDGAERAKEGYWKDSEGFWKYITNRRGVKLEAGKGYILALDLDLMRDNNTSFWANGIQQVELFFPSAVAVENIEETNTEIDVPAHECTITPRPGQTDDRTKKDSHWNIIGVPSYANYGTELKNGSDATITWNDDPKTKNLPFLYEWNTVDNSYSVQSGRNYPFKSMHAYMVQYNGKLKWSLASATPVSPVVARHADAPQDVEFRLELQAGEKVADQTFVKMSTDEQISTAFDFNYDLSKQMNSGKANIYTMVEGYIQTAGNCLPMSEQKTVVPVGVKIAADGDYTFAIPDGTEGVGVTLIDQETGIRTSLSALAYTVTLEAGTYDERFVLEISPIHNVPTEQSAVSDQQTDVRKVLIDGLLYIVRDNKMYDARGAMIIEK